MARILIAAVLTTLCSCGAVDRAERVLDDLTRPAQQVVPAALTTTREPSADGARCRRLTPALSLVDLNSVAALERAAAPETLCRRADGGVTGRVALGGGTLTFERSAEAGFAIADHGEFRAGLRNYRNLTSDPANAKPRAVRGAQRPILAAAAEIDGRACLAFDMYGPERSAGRTDLILYGLLCDPPGGELDMAAARRRIAALRFTGAALEGEDGATARPR